MPEPLTVPAANTLYNGIDTILESTEIAPPLSITLNIILQVTEPVLGNNLIGEFLFTVTPFVGQFALV